MTPPPAPTPPQGRVAGPVAAIPLIGRLGLAAVAGAVTALALAPVAVWVAGCLGLALGFVLLGGARSPAQAALTGWIFACGYFGVALFWIIEPFQVDAARYGWMAPFALVFLALGLGLFWAAAFGLAHRLGGTPIQRVIALVVTWSLVELSRGYVLTGFPWAGISQIWVGQGAALALAWVGPHGLTLLTLISVAAPVLALARKPRAVMGLAGLLPLMALAGGGALVLRALPSDVDTGAVVRLVQPNARQDQKWDPAMIPVFFDRQVQFTAHPPQADLPRPDLIVWPESALPMLLEHAGPALEVIADAAAGAQVVLGAQRRDGERYFNSLAVLGAEGRVTETYDKHHLVPFGEYIPFGDLAARFGWVGFAARQGDGYSAGPGPRLIDLGPKVGKGLPLICYEAVFAQDARVRGARPAVLIQITNDGWFGTRSGPYQHLAQARMRAIEQGLPLIRAANTGVSAMIDPHGRIIGQIPLGQAGFLDAALPAPLPPTLYARTGDLPVVILLVLGFCCLTLFQSGWRRPK